MNKLFQNSFAKVQSIVARGVVCMLLFTVVSCDRADIDNIFTEEVYRSRFVVRKSETCGYTLHFLGGPFIGTVKPVNLPEEYQKDRLIVIVRYQSGETRHCAVGYMYTVIRIVEIEKEIFTSRFYVRKIENCGYLLFENVENLDFPWVLQPVNLQERYQQEGLSVDVTFRMLPLLVVDSQCRAGSFSTTPRMVKIIAIMETPEKRAETRITGGFNANITDNPWQVLLTYRNNFECGGVIIAPNFILTARHCLYCRITGIWRPPSSIRVNAGIACKSEINSSNTFNVSRIQLHYEHIDVALLQLSRDIPFNNRQRAINYLASLNNTFYNVNNSVRVSGWGWTRQDDNRNATCLQYVDLRIIPNQEASDIFHRDPLQDHQMAARGDGVIRQGICRGDSGGPLTIRATSGENVLIGIVQGTSYRCRGDNHNSPSVFVRTSYVVPWILSHVPPIISGPSAVCLGAPATTFSISNTPLPGITVRWTVDAPLSIVSTNNHSVTIRHTGAPTPANSQIRAEVSLNGRVMHTVRHNVAVNIPIIKSITTSPIITTGSPFRFFANHSYGLGLATWSVSPNHGVLMHSSSVTNTFEVSFMFPGHYTVSALVTNACGTSFMNKNITLTGASQPAIRCSFCGTCSTMPPGCVHCPSPDRPPDLLRCPIEENEKQEECSTVLL